MGYATQADLLERFGAQELAQLTDAQGGTIIDETPVARALADADADIDAHLGTRYTLPLATVPTVLVRVACDLARYYLWDQRASDVVRRRYDAAMLMLKGLQRGETVLAGADAAVLEPTGQGGGRVTVSAPTRVFGSSTLDAALGWPR